MNDDRIREGYLRLLEAIAENRVRRFRQAYRAWLDRPDDTNREAKLFQAEQKMKSTPTNYSDGELIAIERMVYNEWLAKRPHQYKIRTAA